MITVVGSRIAAYVLIILLVCGGPLLFFFLRSEQYTNATLRPQTRASFLNGEPTAKFDKLYKDVFPIRTFSVTALNAISYALFHEARKGAVIGSDGWIFTDEEFRWDSKSAANVDKHINEIREVAAKLAAQGTQLVVVLVPQKSSIYQEYLGKVRIPPEQEQLYEVARQKLSVLPGVILPDIKAALMDGKSNGPLFLHTDTHWTVEGAGIVAAAVAKSLTPQFLGDVKQFQRSLAAPNMHSGDLLNFVDLGRWSGLLPVNEEKIIPVVATNTAATVDDFLTAPEDTKKQDNVVLVGTSYSANSLWSFQSQLELALGTAIVNRSEEGKGYAVPMKTFIESPNNEAKDVRLVIWEVPVRYLALESF